MKWCVSLPHLVAIGLTSIQRPMPCKAVSRMVVDHLDWMAISSQAGDPLPSIRCFCLNISSQHYRVPRTQSIFCLLDKQSRGRKQKERTKRRQKQTIKGDKMKSKGGRVSFLKNKNRGRGISLWKKFSWSWLYLIPLYHRNNRFSKINDCVLSDKAVEEEKDLVVGLSKEIKMKKGSKKGRVSWFSWPKWRKDWERKFSRFSWPKWK